METCQRSYKLLSFEVWYLQLVALSLCPGFVASLGKNEREQFSVFEAPVGMHWGEGAQHWEQTCGFTCSLWCLFCTTTLRKKFWEHLRGLVCFAWVESFVIILKRLREAFYFQDRMGTHLPPSSHSAGTSTDSCHADLGSFPPSPGTGCLLAHCAPCKRYKGDHVRGCFSSGAGLATVGPLGKVKLCPPLCSSHLCLCLALAAEEQQRGPVGQHLTWINRESNQYFL